MMLFINEDKNHIKRRYAKKVLLKIQTINKQTI